MATTLRAQFPYEERQIQALARKLGILELTNFTVDEFETLDSDAKKKRKEAVKDLIYAALDLVAGSAEAPIPSNAIVLDDQFPIPYFQDLARRTEANEEKGERRAPAEVLAERFRTKPGQPVMLTEAQLVEEAVRVYHESGKESKTVKDVISEAIRSRCQSQISNYLQTEYGSPRTVRRRDYDHFELAYALLKASLEGKSELTYFKDGEKKEIKVPAWTVDDEGNGYRNNYRVITPSYIIKVCGMAPINRSTNLDKVKAWITEANIQDVVLKVKGNK
jgi:hypothetical protein